jgi:hypothetical protein
MHQAILTRAPQEQGRHRAPPAALPAQQRQSMPPQVITELEAIFGAPLIEAYGMTEATHQMASNPLPPAQRKPGSGGPAAGPEVAIMAEDGTLLPRGEIGEIVIRGPNVTRGYENNPRPTPRLHQRLVPHRRPGRHGRRRPGSPPSRSSSSCPPAPAAAPTRWRASSRAWSPSTTDEAADRRRQQVGRRRRRGLPRRQGRQGRPAQDHHHAVQPVHHAAGHRRALQLARPDAGAMLALDQFVLWVNAESPHKTAKDYLARAVKAGADNKFKMGGTGSKQEDQIITVRSRRPPARSHLRALQGRRRRGGAAGRQARRLDGEQPDRGRVAHWRGASCARCACSTARMPYKDKLTATPVVGRHPDLQVGRHRRGLPDAARHLHGARA